VFAPVDQTLFDEEEDVKVTVLPAQMVIGPAGVIDGVDNEEPTVTVIEFEVKFGQPGVEFVAV
jgi:hypothetical protein